MQSNENDDSWSIENIEEQYIEDIARQPNYDELYRNERDSSVRNVFHQFQDSATSIAQLYRGKIDIFFFLFFFPFSISSRNEEERETKCVFIDQFEITFRAYL